MLSSTGSVNEQTPQSAVDMSLIDTMLALNPEERLVGRST
jgi:hypothetical protein